MTDLKAWLRRSPAPVAVLADERRIEVPTTPRKWQELHDTVSAMSPSRVQCIDKNGAIIRAVTLDEDEEDEKPKQSKDGVTELVQMSRLLADAYDRGSRAQAEAYKAIFEENTKLVRLLADRLGALESAWQRSLQTHAKMTVDLAAARAAGAEGDDESIIQQMIAAFASGQMQLPASPKNGAKG